MCLLGKLVKSVISPHFWPPLVVRPPCACLSYDQTSSSWNKNFLAFSLTFEDLDIIQRSGVYSPHISRTDDSMSVHMLGNTCCSEKFNVRNPNKTVVCCCFLAQYSLIFHWMHKLGRKYAKKISAISKEVTHIPIRRLT